MKKVERKSLIKVLSGQPNKMVKKTIKIVWYQLKGEDVMIVRAKDNKGMTRKQANEIKKQLIKKNGKENLKRFEVIPLK